LNISRKRLPSIFRKRSAKLKRDLEDAVREPGSSSSNTASSPGAASLQRNSSPAQFVGGLIGDEDFDEAAMNGAMEAIGLDDNEYISARFTAGAEIGENSRASIDTLKATGYMGQANPTKILMKFEAHENESHAVRWSPVERMVATGGADRKVKLWDIGKSEL